jgi:hypothetical protein
MKTTFFTLIIGATSLTNAQIVDYGPGFWIQPNLVNPATSGVFNKMAFNYSGMFEPKNGNYSPYTGRFNYNEKFEALHGALGSSTINNTYGKKKDNNYILRGNARINYAFHAQFEKSLLSIGVAGGIDYTENRNNVYRIKTERAAWDLGALYHREHWNLGFSMVSITPKAQEINLTADYRFDLGEKFTIKPSMLFQTRYGFNDLRAAAIVTYNKIIWLSPGLKPRNNVYSIGAGYDYKQMIRVGLFAEATTSKLNNGITSPTFQFNLSYRVKHESK